MNQANIAQTHPLDPATAEELTTAVGILNASGALSENAFYVSGAVAEPPKRVVLDHAPGRDFDRVIQLIGHDRDRKQSFAADVSLTGGNVADITWAEDGQAAVALPDMVTLYEVLLSNDEWVGGLAKRGIDNLEHVHIEPWVAGVRPPEMAGNARVLRAIAFVRPDPDANHYARPVEGLIAWVDTDSGDVIVKDHGVVPIPNDPAEYAADRVATLRQDLKPLEITQPEGPSFTVEGRVIRWQKWQLRVAVTPTEGLVLYDVRYDDDGTDRPILYRASLSDMVVPYGDPSPMHHWKHALDAGETNLGHQANSLQLGCDCLGEIYYFDNTILRSDGKPQVVENAICLHEEDYGVLWKHTNVFHKTPTPEVRRSRRLVVSMFHTVGNYEYGFYWYFYQDGTIQLEVKLTGMIGVTAVDAPRDSDVSPMVSPEIASPIHQHLFCFRLDFDLDGGDNSVREMEVEAMPAGDENPDGTYFRSVSRVLASETEAKRNADPARSRTWRIENPGKINRVGKPVAYKLLPNATPTMLPHPSSPPGRRGAFAQHNLWVTPHADDELYADAGPFSNLHNGGAGLPAYTAADRPIEDTDVVVWHTFGVTHVPRPEDWPVMPVEYAGFTLMPVGFFDQNPALDVPPNKHCHD